jgi:hypothetical protein
MTKAAIKNAFRKLDATEQADVLKDLAANHAKALSEEDGKDAQVFNRRRKEEFESRPWAEVRAKVNERQPRKRSVGE